MNEMSVLDFMLRPEFMWCFVGSLQSQSWARLSSWSRSCQERRPRAARSGAQHRTPSEGSRHGHVPLAAGGTTPRRVPVPGRGTEECALCEGINP